MGRSRRLMLLLIILGAMAGYWYLSTLPGPGPAPPTVAPVAR
jgi:hypothetical protein